MTDERQPTMTETPTGTQAIRLDSGAFVSLTRDVRPGEHGVLFVGAEGHETKLLLSTAALDALLSLWQSPGEALVWRTIMTVQVARQESANV